MINNIRWLVFANEVKCNHILSFKELGFISLAEYKIKFALYGAFDFLLFAFFVKSLLINIFTHLLASLTHCLYISSLFPLNLC